jgi:hypothetical protein
MFMAHNAAAASTLPTIPLDWLNTTSQVWWNIQSAQWQALSAWQQALASIQKEWWDEWTARWAGGAPIGD